MNTKNYLYLSDQVWIPNIFALISPGMKVLQASSVHRDFLFFFLSSRELHQQWDYWTQWLTRQSSSSFFPRTARNILPPVPPLLQKKVSLWTVIFAKTQPIRIIDPDHLQTKVVVLFATAVHLFLSSRSPPLFDGRLDRSTNRSCTGWRTWRSLFEQIFV